MRSKLTTNAQRLRREMTLEERILWYQFLKDLPFPVKRQKVIFKYIVVFYIPSKKIVIAIDGSQHYEKPVQSKDTLRDEDLNAMGLTVLRYSNLDVKQNLQGVAENIMHHLNHPPLGEGFAIVRPRRNLPQRGKVFCDTRLKISAVCVKMGSNNEKGVFKPCMSLERFSMFWTALKSWQRRTSSQRSQA